MSAPGHFAGSKSTAPGALSPSHGLPHYNHTTAAGSPTPASRSLYSGRSEQGSSISRLHDDEQQLSKNQLPQMLAAQHGQWQPPYVHAGTIAAAAAGSPASTGVNYLPPAGPAAAAGAAAVMPQYMQTSRGMMPVRDSSAMESPSRHRRTISAPGPQLHTLACCNATQQLQQLQQQQQQHQPQQSMTGAAGSSIGVAGGSTQPQYLSTLSERFTSNPTFGNLPLDVGSVDPVQVLGTSCDTPDSNCSSHSVVSAAQGSRQAS